MLTAAQIATFHRTGYVLIEDLLSPAETQVLLDHVDDPLRATSDMPDADGRSSKLSLWMDIGSGPFSAVTRDRRIIAGARELLGEDVYHWHSKIMRKEARIGGAWEWHQDYGYWYNDGCLAPQLISCMVAIDRATVANGCLQVMPGSHLIGRIEHGGRGKQAGADPERVAAARERCGVVPCEMPPGSGLFFHSNLLHASAANASDHPRRAFISCYNAFSNAPFGGRGHGRPEPIPEAAPGELLGFATAGA